MKGEVAENQGQEASLPVSDRNSPFTTTQGAFLEALPIESSTQDTEAVPGATLGGVRVHS